MKRASWHVLFWTCYFVYVCVTDSILDPGYSPLLAFIFFVIQNLTLFYGFLFVLKSFSRSSTKKILKCLGRLIAFLLFFFIVRYCCCYFFLPKFIDPAYGNVSLASFTTTSILWITNYFIFAAAYFYLQTSIQKQKDLVKSNEEKAAKEQERLQLENIALRAQINPHFLYNTLGFLYSKALPYSDELSDGIMRLSEMMQYSIKPHDASGRVRLEDEIAHIENVLEINKLRFNQSIYIDFIYEGSLTNAKIVPLILLTLVENVLKHGQLNEPEYPATIHLKLEGGQLTFITHNKKRSGPKEHSTSIGLNNTRKRLESTYGQHFSLTTKEQGDYFTTMLVINNICQAAA